MALLSEEFFSPEDRLSLLALGALSEVSDEGVVLPMNGNTTVHQKKSENPHKTTICELECYCLECYIVLPGSMLTQCGSAR